MRGTVSTRNELHQAIFRYMRYREGAHSQPPVDFSEMDRLFEAIITAAEALLIADRELVEEMERESSSLVSDRPI